MPAEKARVVAVEGEGEAARFRVPQVRLPDAAVARRINTSIVKQVLETVALPASYSGSVGQALALAQKACCTEEETGTPRPGRGLTSCTYQVLYNDGRLLCLEFRLEFTGAYSWGTVRHAAFDMTTGRKLALMDIVADSPRYLRQTLQRAIDRRIAQTLAESLESAGDTSVVADLAERFNWQPLTRHVWFAETAGPGLDDFSVSEHGICVFYQPWLPPALWQYLPEADYFFPFTKLKLTASWRHLGNKKSR